MKNHTIRIASEQDAEALLAIYAPYVQKTAVTFEYETPTVDAFAARIRRILKKYPYLVAEQDKELIGYACAGAFHERAAYAWNVETTVYVRMDRRRAGVGRALYQELEKALAMQNILNMNACIACPEKEDEYLTRDSILFHQRLGFTPVGKFHACGYKFNRWYHMIWMEKHIGEHTQTPAPVRNFNEIRQLYACSH